MNSFERWTKRLVWRAQLLCGLEMSSWALLWALGLTLIGVLLEIFIGSLVSPWIWLCANVFVAIAAFAWGWLRPLDLSALLYEADRRIGWGEKLITLHELKAERSAFVPFLEAHWERLIQRQPVALEKALESTAKRRWAGSFVLGLFCLALANYQGLYLSDIPTAPNKSEARPRAVQAPLPVPTLGRMIEEWRQRLAEAGADLAHNPSDSRARVALEQLQAEITEAQDRLLPMPPLGKENPESAPSRKESQNPDAKATDEPSGPPNSRGDSPRSKLDQLLDDIKAIHGKAQALSREELQKLLDELRSQNPDALAMLERPLDTVETPEELSRQLEEALKHLEERRSLHQQLSDLQRQIQDALSPHPTDAPTDEPPESNPQPLNEPVQGRTPTPREGDGPRDPQGSSEPSGGKGTAPLDPEAQRDLPDLSRLREQIRQIPVKGSPEEQLQVLFEIFQSGMPGNPPSTSRQTITRIDYEIVETLIDSMAVPQELRETVRKYFLALAEKSP